jgi:hypothetical protein
MRYEILHHAHPFPVSRYRTEGFVTVSMSISFRASRSCDCGSPPVPVRVPLPLPKGTIFELQAGLRTETFGAAM